MHEHISADFVHWWMRFPWTWLYRITDIPQERHRKICHRVAQDFRGKKLRVLIEKRFNVVWWLANILLFNIYIYYSNASVWVKSGLHPIRNASAISHAVYMAHVTWLLMLLRGENYCIDQFVKMFSITSSALFPNSMEKKAVSMRNIKLKWHEELNRPDHH